MIKSHPQTITIGIPTHLNDTQKSVYLKAIESGDYPHTARIKAMRV